MTALRLDGGFTTRFAPAPTGLLHLGHAVNAACVWGAARAFGGRVLLRIEDHDRGRCRPEYERALLDDLDWLGLEPDLGTTAEFRRGPHAHRQSDQSARYQARLAQLESQGLVYPCTCSRADIARESTGGEAKSVEVRYPGTCRDAARDPRSTAARRIRSEAGRTERFHDLRLGELAQDPDAQCGDLLARDRNGHWTYQFAVTVDDLEQGIDIVIRGEDLLASTGRQLRLARMLGRTRMPRFLHHPLVLHPDGRKLSKSAGDTGIRELREAGHTPAEVLGLAAHAAGLQPAPDPIGADSLASLFR